LEIAGLHGAVDRRVRGYSQGMRQRLGVAQAMLGLPDVLILDEPTNGLDPPQIQRMRSVLTDYAATGRTVIVSSHLISEVEQSCSHVVVMRAGAVVLTGSVAELISTGSTVAVDVDDVQRAATVLRDSAGIGAVDVAGPTRVVAELAGARRDEVVSRLVGGGLAVTSVSSTARLEDIVLQAIGDGGVQ
jgi:ABC-2 type transport system ATP-binding protein